MADSQNYHHHLGPPTISSQTNNHYNLSMLYCGFFVVVTVGLILGIYHCVAFNWCTVICPSSWLRNHEASTSDHHHHHNHRGFNPKKVVMELDSTLFKYEKGGNNGNANANNTSDDECAVCLSVFEEGEDVRKLVRCEHSYHAPCIDMWLYSHFDCPLCRTPVGGCDGGGGGGGTLSDDSSGVEFSDSEVLPV